jgi:hypothetical protein
LSEKVIREVSDGRLLPRIDTAVPFKAGLVLFWARLGSLNALGTTGAARFWKQWLGEDLCSADTMGRVHALMDAQGLRKGLHRVYACLKRNKALLALGGWEVAVLDGHETHSSYRRHCSGCLKRTLHTSAGKRIQYYHRHVTLLLLTEKLRLLLDLEVQRPGEDEVTTALRLVERVVQAYPRAFKVVLADALYAEARFVNFLFSQRKHILIVLKDERRDLYRDALALFGLQQPQRGAYRNRQCLWWDVQDLNTWPQVRAPLRVVRSQETYFVRRQMTGDLEQQNTEWMWVSTLTQSEASTDWVVRLGHARWDIENYGFNELVNAWHADHVYKHDSHAMETFALVAFLAYNLFHAFLILNLKPQLRRARTEAFWARAMAAEIYQDALEPRVGHPP